MNGVPQPEILKCKSKKSRNDIYVNARYIVSYWEDYNADKQDVNNDNSTIYVQTITGDELIYKEFRGSSLSDPRFALDQIRKAIQASA